jgi:DNA-binding NarL/FixJ family response regulator
MKHEAIDELRSAIRRVLDGGVHVSPRASDRLLRAIAQGDAPSSESPVERLSDRELEVFELIGQGHGATEIARKLHLSVKTIETYQSKLKEKLSLKDAGELLKHALRWREVRDS